MRHPTLVMQHPNWVINASRSLFLPLTKTSYSSIQRAIIQPTSGISEMAAKVGYKRERYAAHPSILTLILVYYCVGWGYLFEDDQPNTDRRIEHEEAGIDPL